ncbi:MAG TPA: cytochrome c3 family protein [Myxococcota bacterium]|nr:cytochrome c3 family protein [Myxococcota bacterium]
MESDAIKLILLAVAALASAAGCGEAEAIVQPIRFSHALHVGTHDMACAECHRTVESARFAGRPGVEVCGSCHDVMLGDSAEEARVVAHVEENREIPWNPLDRSDPSVFFSHARHVKIAAIECETCHGAMAEAQSPPPAALVRLSMEDCIGCHRARNVRDDCNACHR